LRCGAGRSRSLWNNEARGAASLAARDTVTLVRYEYPLNESIRTMLRLEHLFDRLGQLVARDAALDHHFALSTLFEIVDVASRADLKSDLLKELERHKSQLAAFRGNPGVSEAALDSVLGRIEHAHAQLNALPGKAGQSLTTHDFLMSIRSRINIPGGTCEFDLPGYFAWQQHDAARRRADLLQWIDTVSPVAESLSVLLGLLRDTGTPQRVVARGGQFQQSLPQGRTFQLLRVRVDDDSGVVPEISGHRLIISIRLMRPDADGRLKNLGEDQTVELTLCA
jgi:cell division protein ZapD